MISAALLDAGGTLLNGNDVRAAAWLDALAERLTKRRTEIPAEKLEDALAVQHGPEHLWREYDRSPFRR